MTLELSNLLASAAPPVGSEPRLPLLPRPQSIQFTGGTLILAPDRLILLDSPRPQGLLQPAARLQRAMLSRLGFFWGVNASRAVPPARIGLTLRLTPAAGLPPQGYEVAISPHAILARAGDEAGLFYAICTLIQVIEQSSGELPCLEIKDWPDIPARGVMLDISRDKVPTLPTLFDLVDLLAGWKFNQLQLYTEHTFAYQQHPQVWANASPFTAQEIMELDSYCRERFIELVPNQNSFGHLHRWLEHPRYAPLAEVCDGFDAPWGRIDGPFSLCPTDPASLELVAGLYDELLPQFSSRMVNVGCDETFDLGQGRSAAACDERGSGPVYLEFLLAIHRNLKARGYTMQFWGDIVTQHPELIPLLPRDLIALEWGYEHNHPFAENTARYAEAGIPFYVCPGTSAWCSLAGRTGNAIANLLCAAEYGIKHGAIGYLVTDWGDNGHWQFLPASYLGFAAGAAFSWALAKNRELDVPDVLDRFAFKDRAGVMGRLAWDLGDLYQSLEIEWINSSALFWILQRTLETAGQHPKIRSIPYERVLVRLEQVMAALDQADMVRSDARLVKAEYALTARLLAHACRRGRLARLNADDPASSVCREEAQRLDLDLQETKEDFAGLWLQRNRPGGLTDSLARFTKTRRDYQELIRAEVVPSGDGARIPE
jgi:hexosaminidase